MKKFGHDPRQQGAEILDEHSAKQKLVKAAQEQLDEHKEEEDQATDSGTGSSSTSDS